MLHVPSSQASYLPSPVFCQAMHHSRAGIITGGMSRVAGEERSGSVSNMSAGPLPLLKGGDEHSGHLRTKPESTPRPFCTEYAVMFLTVPCPLRMNGGGGRCRRVEYR